ncbi:inorganic phosphate transporter [Halodesulfovibrio marinisediminis]|uniref:Phosphate transporter n=1 Tax=Halodesulfovibrio marinisediminis DSM 17456 TaxID=1121457 RepID=A0A1N6F5C3_9BACT|nr:inorganic phosphate transporter [Halodesulfovibrio marinisediminis]SIN90449.1 inorganic phosphate transporter, PiT family [Halodesulfovibrio marinisediminis DSM 17456]
MLPVFLSSGLFLGWSLGANDAANVFGAAVGSRMVRFRTAAIISSLCVIFGAMYSGSGTADTLGKLGEVNALAGAFMVAFSAAITVYLLVKARCLVSTSQAIVGAVVGWNLFSGSATDPAVLSKIMLTWVACPALSAVFSILLYKCIAGLIRAAQLHIFTLDGMTRWGLILAGAFGSYALGANNMANVMGVFIPVAHLQPIEILPGLTLNATQQLFFLGGIAVSIGIFTYSRRTMMLVGGGIVKLSPVASFVVVMANSLVLFMLSSQGLSNLSVSLGLPPIPLVPVSSSQATIGAIVGIGLLKGGRGIRWRSLANIAFGWILTPVMAATICFICLFFLQNVFQQTTFQPISYELTPSAWEKLTELDDIKQDHLDKIDDLWLERFPNAREFREALAYRLGKQPEVIKTIMHYARRDSLRLSPRIIERLSTDKLTTAEITVLKNLSGQVFVHRWRLKDALGELSSLWRYSDTDVEHNKKLDAKFKYLDSKLHVQESEGY